LYDEAKAAEVPKLLSGAANKRLKICREKQEKDPSTLSEEDKFFLEFVAYVHKKRNAHFAEKKKLSEAVKSEDSSTNASTPMEVETTAATAAAAPAPAATTA
jgi:phosphoribosylanthranilate isomerase